MVYLWVEDRIKSSLSGNCREKIGVSHCRPAGKYPGLVLLGLTEL